MHGNKDYGNSSEELLEPAIRARNARTPERLDPVPPLDLTRPRVKPPEFGDSDGRLTHPSHIRMSPSPSTDSATGFGSSAAFRL